MRGGFRTALDNCVLSNSQARLEPTRDLRRFFNEWYRQRQRHGGASPDEVVEMQTFLFADVHDEALPRFPSDGFNDDGEAA